jgi:hypothetical protein
MELDLPGRHLAMTQELMHFNMKTGGPIERVTAFEVLAERLESQRGTFVDESMKVAKLLGVAPDDVKNSVLMGVTDLTACDPARRFIMTVLQGKRSWQTMSSGQKDMEIDAFGEGSNGKGGKGEGGKGKSKDKGGGKAQDSKGKGKGDEGKGKAK